MIRATRILLPSVLHTAAAVFPFSRSFGRRRHMEEDLPFDALDESKSGSAILSSDPASNEDAHISSQRVLSGNLMIDEATPGHLPTEAETRQTRKSYRVSDAILTQAINKDADSSVQSSIRKGGLADLSSAKEKKRVVPAKELQSHVPSEVTVTKYGYIEHRVIGVLDELLDYGGFFSTATRKSVSFDHIELSQNGRDMNILYHIHKVSNSNSIRRSLSVEEEEVYDPIPIVNERYMEKRRNWQSSPSPAVLESKRRQLQNTHRYQHYPLSLEDVRIIDEIERSTKAIRYELCKRLNIKRVPQLHFVHSTK